MCFNSRTHAGCDDHEQQINIWLRKFQFTHPRGVRRIMLVEGFSIHEFQFTHPRGVRLTGNFLEVSIIYGFNSRTHAGCDTRKYGKGHETDCFNSRTHAGCDILLQISGLLPDGFNSRTHAGCDMDNGLASLISGGFLVGKGTE